MKKVYVLYLIGDTAIPLGFSFDKQVIQKELEKYKKFWSSVMIEEKQFDKDNYCDLEPD